MKRLVAIESPSSAVASPVPSMNSMPSLPVASRSARCIVAASKSTSPFMTKAAVGTSAPLITAWVTPVSMRDSAAGLAATTMSQPSTQIGAARGDAHGVKIVGRRREADMAHHRAVLLRKAGEVEHRAALALEMRRHAEQRADGDDAGAADAGDEDAVGLARAALAVRERERGEGIARHCCRRPLRLAQARRHAP